MSPELIQGQIAMLLAAYPELQEDDILRADMIEGETDAHRFLRMVERRRQEATSFAGAIAANIAELGLRQERYERREKAMRELMFKIMQAGDLRKMELPEATLSVRPGTPKVIVTDDNLIPDALCRFKREPDKTKIKEQLLNGNGHLIPGASLSNAEPVLSIRTK
jgi:hypothetical protein